MLRKYRASIFVTLRPSVLDTAQEQVDRMCDQMLANPVIENYRFDLKEVSVEMGASA